jgi:hypothetical protein
MVSQSLDLNMDTNTSIEEFIDEISTHQEVIETVISSLAQNQTVWKRGSLCPINGRN